MQTTALEPGAEATRTVSRVDAITVTVTVTEAVVGIVTRMIATMGADRTMRMCAGQAVDVAIASGVLASDAGTGIGAVPVEEDRVAQRLALQQRVAPART